MRAVTRSQECEPGWTHEEMAARQDADPDIGPIMRWKRVGNDRPRWEDISPESRETKVLWRQWERLYLVRGVLHRQFHELEGRGWRPQLVVPADRRGSLLQRFHGGMIGAHLGTTRTMALAEQGFYWPGMRADVSRICNECDCAMLKRRRGRREPLHQYIVGVPMERLAMDVAGPYPVTSAGNQYCLMVGCYFSKWLECFPIPVAFWSGIGKHSRKLSDGYRNSYVYFHRDSRLGAEHDGAKGRPVLLEGRRQTVWGRRRERPGR